MKSKLEIIKKRDEIKKQIDEHDTQSFGAEVILSHNRTALDLLNWVLRKTKKRGIFK